ncbi:hypothetical protein AALP_AA4G013600 [Arabis alpina]|uniref:Protein kinase domain-containing protein n=1 Tax=Arabis alpina TaxID=50452 RepID=A0A087H0F9_ARAAL|nr:hypothetical protein AALP_AA4G013600 [Arabis alpina]
MEDALGKPKNESHRDHHHQSPQSHRSEEQHHHGLLSMNAMVIFFISIISIFIIFAILLIILLLHRLKSARENAQHLACKESCSILNNGGPPTSYSYTSSPDDIKRDCLHARNPTSFRQLPPHIKSSRRSRAEGVEVYTYKELEIATNNFSEEKKIGSGGYGEVYKGILNDGTVAAIKKLHMPSPLPNPNGSNQKHEDRSFRLEVDLLSRLQCPYLVELLGYCADQNHRILIFEYMPNGTLEHHLHDQSCKNQKDRLQPLDWGTRLRIAFDCARALEFLHENTVPVVIHRDFKCTNILLDHNNRAKVSDFGLAKTGSDKLNGQISTRVLGTTGYLAPEYASTGKLTTKSDVYSYGMVLLQLLTGRPPIDSRRPSGEDVLVSWALPRLTNREKVSEMVDPAIQGQYSQKDLIQVAAIAAMCVQPEPDYRPLITDVVHSLIPLVKAYNQSNVSSRIHSRRESLTYDDIMS